MSEPTFEYELKRDALSIPMRDGTRLMADLYLPKGAGPWPVLVERTPYDKGNSVEVKVRSPGFFASRGYAMVIQDTRGRFKSDGEFYPFADDGWGERKDGYDTVEWLAAQPWCNGKVGTLGGSYSGHTQHALAPTQPPHLVCQYIREQTGDPLQGLAYRGGAFELGLMLGWAVVVNNQTLATRVPHEQAERARGIIAKAMTELDAWYLWLPLKEMPLLREPGFGRWYYDYMDHPTPDAFWREWTLEPHYPEFNTPVYHMGGWGDLYVQPVLDKYVGVVKAAKSDRVRKNQKLIMGPWVHGTLTVNQSQIGEYNFGPEAAMDHNVMRLAWFDHWMKGIDTGLMDEPAVRYFTMGTNRWQTAATWPPAGITPTDFYFHGGTSGSATSLNDGVLSAQPPDEQDACDRYEYDPANPVETLGGAIVDYNSKIWGPRDQRPVEARCLTYTSAPLEHDLEVTGRITATLFAMSSALDTDWVVRLTDVSPDGNSRWLVDGILRARYRESLERETLLTPNHVYRFVVDLWSTSNVFLKGHRIRVAVTSSSFPRWDRNMNTGGPFGVEAVGRVALNTVFRDGARASHITLPVRGGASLQV